MVVNVYTLFPSYGVDCLFQPCFLPSQKRNYLKKEKKAFGFSEENKKDIESLG